MSDIIFKTDHGPRLPQAIPFGWYFVGYSDELAVGEVKALEYFDRDLVMFRNENGEVGVLDAYCPHMGAHLGYGGSVEGDSLRCPFHAWGINPDAIVTEVPYAKQIPPKVAGKQCMHKYPSVEKNKVIWAWYHPENKAPFFDVMEHEEIGHEDWIDLKKFEWEVDTNVQEIAENGVDVAHFKYVHSMDAVPEGETTYEGHIRNSKAFGQREIPQPDGTTKTVDSKVHTVQNGAGQKFTKISGLSETLLMVLVTPLNREKVMIRFAFTHKDFAEDTMEYKVAQASIESTVGARGVVGDIPIWNKKIHRANPILCDGDGPIMQYRKYFSQFYAENQTAEEKTAELEPA